MNNKIYALIVIYNKNIEESVSYQCLKDTQDISIIVCDNSTQKLDNIQKVHGDKNTYISMDGNKGLSRAYNTVLEYLNGKDGWLCIFDDDTFIPSDYFEKLRESIKLVTADIYVPVVRSQNGIMSPVSLKDYKINKVNDINTLTDKTISAINSGLAISLAILKDYRYDENLFLDFVDYNFFLDMRSKNAKIKIIGCELKQEFSAECGNKVSQKIRFKIKKKDLRYFYRRSIKTKLYYHYLILRMKAKLLLKYHDIKIIGW